MHVFTNSDSFGVLLPLACAPALLQGKGRMSIPAAFFLPYWPDKHYYCSRSAPSDSPADAGQVTPQASGNTFNAWMYTSDPAEPQQRFARRGLSCYCIIDISSNLDTTADVSWNLDTAAALKLGCCQRATWSGVISMAQGSGLGWSGPGHLSQCLDDHWRSH